MPSLLRFSNINKVKFAGSSFAATGDCGDRCNLRKAIESLGGCIRYGSMREAGLKKLDYLIVGRSPGSKLHIARDNRIPLINYNTARQILTKKRLSGVYL